MKTGGNHLVLQNLRDDYPNLVSYVRTNGAPVSVDGELSYELRNLLITVLDPYDAMPLGVGAKFDEEEAAVAFITTAAASSHTEKMMALEQLIRVDHTTRIAGFPLGIGASFQFLYRDEQLQLHISSPYNDLVGQFPYSLFVMTQLQLTMANVLGIEPGPYYHHSVTLFLRAGDTGLLDYLTPTTVLARPPDNPRGLEGVNWEGIETRAQFLLDVAGGLEGVNWEVFTPTELWLLKRLGATP